MSWELSALWDLGGDRTAVVTLPAVLGRHKGVIHHWGCSDQLPVLWFILNSSIKQGWTFIGAAEPVLLRAASRSGQMWVRLWEGMEGCRNEGMLRLCCPAALCPRRCSHRNNFGSEV